MDKKKIKKIIVLIAVICIPIMYSFFYLKSYWDPYGNLKGMKIAIVNLDQGENGENQGEQLVNGLIEKDVVTVVQANEEEAQEGLINEEYFAVITIPSNFTSYLNSASTTDKKISTITYSPNQKMNYLASQIVSKVISAVELELQSQVSEKVVDTLADKLESVPESLGKINDGADEILNGATSLSSGLNEINNGMTTLNNSYTEFDNGVNSAYTGSQTLGSGISQVNTGVGTLSNGTNTLDSAINQINTGANTLATQADAGIHKLSTGIDQLNGGAAQVAAGTAALEAGTAANSQLASGASQVAAGTSSLANATSSLEAGATQVSNGLAGYTATVNGLAAQLVAAGAIDEGTRATLEQTGAALVAGASSVSGGISQLNASAQTLNAGANAVSGGITTLNSQVQALNAGATQVSNGATTLASNETKQSLSQLTAGITTLQSALGQVQTGTQTLKSGVGTLSNGTNQLQNGSNSLTSGLATLSSSSGQVKNALGALSDGSQKAYAGSLELVDGVQTFKTEVGKGLDEANQELVKLDGLSEFVKNPVEIKEVDYGEVSTYGVAFTPLFISVALWVGALMAYVVLYYDQDKRFKLLGKFADNKIVQCGLYFAIAIIQGLVTAFLLKVGLGMEIQNMALYYVSAIAIAITFMSIIQFLILNFGEAGKFVALLLLVLQLASSGGTFPVEIIDKGFQKISPYMPMTYTIKLMKESLILEREGVAGHNLGVMLGITIVCLMLTVAIELIKKYYKKKKEEKSVETADVK